MIFNSAEAGCGNYVWQNIFSYLRMNKELYSYVCWHLTVRTNQHIIDSVWTVRTALSGREGWNWNFKDCCCGFNWCQLHITRKPDEHTLLVHVPPHKLEVCYDIQTMEVVSQPNFFIFQINIQFPSCLQKYVVYVSFT